jgi:hypothetical protein
LAPQTSSSGGDVFEEFGLGFTPLSFDAHPRPFEDLARSLKLPVKIVRDSYAGGRQHGVSADLGILYVATEMKNVTA